MLRAKYIRNATDGNGTLLRGDIYQVGIPDLLGGDTGHRMWEVSTVQKYSIGARFVTPDGRVFRYAKAGGTLVVGQGAHNYETENYIRYAVLPAGVKAGSSTISLTVDAHDGAKATHNGSLAANELVGGYILVFDKTATNHVVIRTVLSNTVVASGGGTTVVTVDAPYPLALEIGTDAAAAMASPYLNVQSNSVEVQCCVGVPTVPADSGEYFWLQTWGVCWIASAADVGTGISVHESFFGGNGALVLHGAGANLQHAGFMISSRARDGAQGETFIMLQISI